MRLLVVEDDRAVREALDRTLRLEGHEVLMAATGGEALARCSTDVFDLIILDVGVPSPDGLQVCAQLRADGSRVPILMLTARSSVEDRIDGLDAGADDYMIKPFDLRELTARVRALLRRTDPDAAEAFRPSWGGLTVDPGRHGIHRDGVFVELSQTEYALMELFIRNPRVVLSHETIYQRVWGYDFGPASNALRVYVGYLRRKLAILESAETLQTIRGVGYVLREP